MNLSGGLQLPLKISMPSTPFRFKPPCHSPLRMMRMRRTSSMNYAKLFQFESCFRKMDDDKYAQG